MRRVLYCSRRISFVVNFCCWLISSLTAMARDALRVCHCCLLAEILWTSGGIALRVSWKLRASEAEVVIIVAPTRTRVGQDWRDIDNLLCRPLSVSGATIPPCCNPARSSRATPRPSLPSLRSPHRAQRPPPPIHTIHQHPNRLSHANRHRALLTLYIQQHRLSLRTHSPQRAHRVHLGVLSHG